MVITVRDEWQNKRTSSKSGRAMKHFTSFCETLKAHSYMLEILPEGSEYVSLFTGSLKTIINVRESTHHFAHQSIVTDLISNRQAQITRRSQQG